MKMTKLLVFSGAFDQESAGDTFSPPHMRMGSSAAFFFVSMPPSAKEDDVTAKGAAAACPRLVGMANAAATTPKLRTPHLPIMVICENSLSYREDAPYHRRVFWETAGLHGFAEVPYGKAAHGWSGAPPL